MEEVFFERWDGKKVAGYLGLAKDREELVLIVHGFGSNKEGAGKILVNLLNQKGKSALAIDLDDVGNSDMNFEDANPTEYVKEVEAAIKFGKEKGFTIFSIIGHSFGGFVSLITAWRNPMRKVALRAPVIDFYDGATRKTEKNKERLKTLEKGFFYFKDRNGAKRRVKAHCVKDAQQYPMFEHIQEINSPIRIIHGTEDNSIPLSSSIKAAKDNMNVELKILEGADHLLKIKGSYEEGNKLVVDFLTT